VLDLGMKGAGTRGGRRNRLATTMLAFSACVAMLPAAWGRQQGQQQAGTQSPSQNQSQTQNQQTRAQGQSSSGRALWLKLSSADPVAAQNLDQVAASTSEIRTVLTQNPGLMIELKRLLALRATERGQILTE
jgi:hypothetical protein